MILWQAFNPQTNVGLLKVTVHNLYPAANNRDSRFLFNTFFWDTVERVFNKGNKFFVIEVSGSYDTDILTDISLPHKIEHLLAANVTNNLRRAYHRPAQRVARPEAAGELVVDRFFRAVVNHGDFLNNNATFFFNIVEIEFGIADQVTEQINRHRHLLSEDFNEITTEFTTGKAVEESAD